MLEPIVSFFEKLVENFTWSRLLFIIGLMLIFAFGLLVFELYTNKFLLGKLESEINLLSDAVELANSAEFIEEKERIRKGFEHVLIRFNVRYEDQTRLGSSLNLSSFVTKSISAAFPWAILLLLVMLTSSGKGRASAIGGVLLFATPFIIIGANLPDFIAPWINRWAYPWSTMILTIVFIFWWQQIKKKSST